MMDQLAIRALLAKQEITEALHRYCRAMDRMDNELGFTIFHPDAFGDYGEMFQGSAHDFVVFANERHAGVLTHQHQLGNILIRVDGDQAFSESYVTAAFRLNGDDGELLEMCSRGRYVDRWEKRDGRWAISRRNYIHIMDDTWPVTKAGYGDWGRRDRSDLSYIVEGPMAGSRG